MIHCSSSMQFKKRFLTQLVFSFLIITSVQAQVKSHTFSELEQKINSASSDSIYVINFWATWCGPCIKELPNFKDAQDSLAKSKVKFIFVSLDFPGSENRVLKVFTSKNLAGEVLMLNEPDANVWINKLAPEWQGDIPATWFVNKSNKTSDFHAGTIETTEIIQKVNNLKK
jgi:thiol-disulfide isomerase/thioredoxin